MPLLESLATAFFRTFGITQPNGRGLRRASWFLAGMLLLAGVGLALGAALLLHLL